MVPAELARQFEREGWLQLPLVVEPALTAAVVESLIDRTRRRPDEKVQDAWRSVSPVRQLATHPGILSALHSLMGRRPIPFQTLNFRRGSEQRLHADSIHFDSLPSGLMCGVWVALEDVGPDQGPIRLVPGSHEVTAIRPERVVAAPSTFNYAAYEDLVADRLAGLTAQEFLARRGEVLVWSAHLAHGGSPVRRLDSTRWSQVTHYFFEGAAYITPMSSDLRAAEYRLRDPLTDISTGRRVRHRLDGAPATVEHLPGGRSRLLPADAPMPSVPRRVRSAAVALTRRVRTGGAVVIARRRSTTGR